MFKKKNETSKAQKEPIQDENNIFSKDDIEKLLKMPWFTSSWFLILFFIVTFFSFGINANLGLTLLLIWILVLIYRSFRATKYLKSLQNTILEINKTYTDNIADNEVKLKEDIVEIDNIISEKNEEVNRLESTIHDLEEKLTISSGELLSAETKLKEIKSECENKQNEYEEKLNFIKEYENKKEEYRKLLDKIQESDAKIAYFNLQKEEYNNIKKEIEEKKDELDRLKSEIIETNDIVLLQSLGFYEPHYNFENSEQYMSKLKDMRNFQQESIKNRSAVEYNSNWIVDGSAQKGKMVIEKNIKSAFKLFNIECELIISKVSYKNIEQQEKRIRKSFKDVNSLYKPLKIQIKEEYLASKIDELYLCFEYEMKKQEEKEEQAILREQMREEARVQKEIEEEKKKIQKEKIHFYSELERLQNSIPDDESRYAWQEQIDEIRAKLEELKHVEEDVLHREASTRAGYVYIISNIGSFGENIYKIGLTRRLDPMERINELGGASVPFKFDVHATIFSEDAPALETALHKAFNNRRVNKVNSRKEFFNVTLEEIKEVVENNFNSTVEYTKYAEAMEYRQSLKLAAQGK